MKRQKNVKKTTNAEDTRRELHKNKLAIKKSQHPKKCKRVMAC